MIRRSWTGCWRAAPPVRGTSPARHCGGFRRRSGSCRRRDERGEPPWPTAHARWIRRPTSGSTPDPSTPTRAPRSPQLERFRERWPWLDHLVRAGARYTEHHGDHYAAAITYFSVLALVPLLMVAFAAAGLRAVLQPGAAAAAASGHRDERCRAGSGELHQPDRRQGDRPAPARSGSIGLLGALYSGIGWMSNLREALSEQWGAARRRPRRCSSGCCSTCSPCSASGSRWSARSRSPAVARVLAETVLGLVGLGDAGLGTVPAGLLGDRARPGGQLADLPVGDRPAAARARHAAQRAGRRCWARSGSRSSSRSMVYYLGRSRTRPAARCSAAPRPAGVHVLHLAVHPVRHGLGRDAPRRRTTTRRGAGPRR